MLEKVPLLLMALAISLMTFSHVERAGGMVSDIPLADRLAVSLAAYLGYLEKTFWPANLAALYPYRVPPWWVATFAAVLLLAISAAFVYLGRRRPMLLVGWLWFVGTLFPVSGIVQIGQHNLADRYSYVPHLGLLITVVWGISGLTVWKQASPGIRKALSTLTLAALAMLTWVQVWTWQNTETLFRHALSVTEDNYEFHAGLGSLLEKQGQFADAEYHMARAVKIKPKTARFYLSYGALLVNQEKYQDGIVQLKTALSLDPEDAETHYVLGVALDKLGKREDAKHHLEKSIACWESRPPLDFFAKGSPVISRRKVRPHLALSEMALREGKPNQALAQIERALEIKPDLAEGHQFKGIALGRLGRWKEAEMALQDALKVDPHHAGTRGFLAFAYARQNKMESSAREYADLLAGCPEWLQTSNDFALKRLTKSAFLDPRMAEDVARQICEATSYQDPRWLDTLAAAEAARGDFASAKQTARKALAVTADPGLARQLQDRLRLYENNWPLPKD